jgi:hypothetical protein
MFVMTGSVGAAIEPPVGELIADQPIARTASPRLGPAAQTVLIVWATCLLLALSYPQALASWLDDFEPNPVVDAAQSCVGRLAAVSEALGIARFSNAVRDLGRSITHRPE